MERTDFVLAGIGVFLLILIGCVFVFSSSMEMKTFNKFTKGQKATLQDAMFSELRVFAEQK